MSNLHAARTAEQVLREFFGLQVFRGLQEPVIRSVLEQKSALAVFPTGAGKSLCYQVPALLLDGLTLVVSPLIALMKDQVENLQGLGIPAARIDSTLADDEVEEIFRKSMRAN
ncbi:MAG: DEAD/DEAH box helicase, partial [Armatimonadaceae bacterium]